MIDGHFKASIDRFWNVVARGLVRLGLTPNQVTWLGLVGVALACAAYLWHRDDRILGLCLAVLFAFDSLDGAVARLTDASSRYGGYLDAVVDRYQEGLALLAIAWVHDFWILSWLVVTGSLLTSYAKARVAVEMPIDNNAWPDLMERLERVLLLCSALLFDSLVPLTDWSGHSLLFWALALMALLTHLTAVQRFWRARAMLRSQG